MTFDEAVLGQLNWAFHDSDDFTVIGLYKQYVLPHMELVGKTRSPWTANDKEEALEKVQQRATSMVSGLQSHKAD